MTTLLVTGGAGFIGSALVRRLLTRTDYTVINVDKLTYAGHLESLETVGADPRHRFERADISDTMRMRDIIERHRPDAMVHLAAESHVDRSIDGPAAFIQTNVVGTFVLLEEALRYWRSLDSARRERFRFVHVSTDEVYGSLPGTERATESGAYRPSSPYAASKAASDHLARSWSVTYGLPVVTTNSSNNYGPYQFPEKLIPLMIHHALRGEALPVYGDGSQIRDWLHVNDHAEALQAVVERGVPGRSYNVAGGAERRNIDVVRAICTILDELAPDPRVGRRESLITHVADRPGHDARYAIDASRIQRELGWRPEHVFEAGLRETVTWYLGHQEWCERVTTSAYRGERLGLGTAR